MGKYMKRSIYMGLSALMALSVANVPFSAPNVNAKSNHYSRLAHSHKRTSKIHMTSHWYKSGGFNHKLNGRYLVCNQPSIFKNAHAIAGRNVIKDVKVFAYSGRMYNHTHKYYKVVNEKGDIQGWVKASGVSYVKPSMPKGSFTKKDKKAYRSLEKKLAHAQTLITSAKDADRRRAKKDVTNVKQMLKSANTSLKRIKSHKLRNKAKKMISNSKAYINKVSNYDSKLLSTGQDYLEKQIKNDISSAQHYLDYTKSHHGSQPEYLLQVVSNDIINKAQSENNEIKNSATRHSNNSLIQVVRNYRNALLNSQNKNETKNDNTKNTNKSNSNNNKKNNNSNNYPQAPKVPKENQVQINARAFNSVKEFSAMAQIELGHASSAKGNVSVAMDYVNRANEYARMAVLARNMIKGNSNELENANSIIHNINYVF